MEIIDPSHGRGLFQESARNPTRETTVESHPSKNEGWGTRAWLVKVFNAIILQKLDIASLAKSSHWQLQVPAAVRLVAS
jgi:hypothetical protein